MMSFFSHRLLLSFILLTTSTFLLLAHEEGKGTLLNRFEQQMHFTRNKAQWDAKDLYGAFGFAYAAQINKNNFMLGYQFNISKCRSVSPSFVSYSGIILKSLI